MIKDKKIHSVAVMMATYNGKKYIVEQIETILNQTGVIVDLYVRDDGSTDGTLKILKNYEKENKLHLFVGENLGPSNNFFELLRLCGEADYYAWADQDDIWDVDKLLVAVNKLDNIKSKYKLYWCQQRLLIDGEICKSNNNKIPSMTFAHSLMSSNAQGATMVFNNELKETSFDKIPDFKSLHLYHDAWMHKVCMALGGTGYYDAEPHITYRIHGENVFAKKEDQKSHKVKDRLYRQFCLKQNYNSRIALELLNCYGDQMPQKNRKLATFLAYYQTKPSYKIKLLISTEFKRKKIDTDLMFITKCIFNRL